MDTYIYIHTISYIIYIELLLQIQLSPLAMSHHVQSADGSGLSSSPPATATAATAAAPVATEPVEAKAKAQPAVLYTNKRGLTQETCQALWFDGSVGHLANAIISGSFVPLWRSLNFWGAKWAGVP